MRVKIAKGESTKEIENEINSFLLDRKDIEVIDIREVRSVQFYLFMIMYEYKKEIDGRSAHAN